MLTKFTLYLCVFLSLSCLNSYAQNSQAKKQMERYEKELAEKEVEYINKTVNSLNVDEFEKVIIKQKMASYFDEKIKIFQRNLSTHEREAAISNLNDIHFLEVKAMVSEDTYQQLLDACTLTQSQQQKKKKKQGKAKKKKSNSQ